MNAFVYASYRLGNSDTQVSASPLGMSNKSKISCTSSPLFQPPQTSGSPTKYGLATEPSFDCAAKRIEREEAVQNGNEP